MEERSESFELAESKAARVRPGRVLSHYRILDTLGEGGMGVVYLAEDTELKRQVALKLLPPELASDPEPLERFRREARAVASLNHPNIVTVHSLEEADGVRFLTMERIHGEGLDRIVSSDGLALERVLEIAVPLADGLAAAHEQGIVHRDLKPANVMLAESGQDHSVRLKILDFGLAKLLQPERDNESRESTEILTGEGNLVGTIAYMSPEQLEGGAADQRSDIFAFGVLLYELAAGRRPFSGASLPDLMFAILRDTPEPITDVKPGLPLGVGVILERCLAKDPNDRYPSAREVLDALRLLAVEVESGTALEMAEVTGAVGLVGVEAISTADAAPRRRAWIAAGVTAVTLLALTGGYVATRDRRAPPDALAASAPATALLQRRMIAVLPFENLGSPEDAYFAAGITEEITGRLAAIRGLGVISRKSARRYAGTQKSIEQIGEELGVAYVLEGTVRWARSGNGPGKVRITPQLVRVADDSNLWAEVYDRVLDDVFEVQTDVALSVLRELDVALLQPERDALEIRPTGNLDAYQAYLRGLNALEPEWSPETVRLAAEMFERAVELDPEFAHAHAWLAMTHGDLVSGVAVSPEERRDRCRRTLAAAERALELAPDLPYAQVAMGNFHFRCARDYQRALEALAVAEAALPNDPEVMKWTAIMRRRQGYVEEAAERLERAVELDPRDAELAETLAFTFTMLRRYQEADVSLARSIALAPDQERAYQYRAWNFLHWRGDTDAAREVLEAMPTRRSPWSIAFSTMVDFYARDYSAMLEKLESEPAESFPPSYPRSVLRGLAYSQMGLPERARGAWEAIRLELEEVLAADPDHHVLRIRLSWAYAQLGRRSEAIREVERAIAALPITEDVILGSLLLHDAIWTYVFAGDYDTAIEYIDRLLSIPSGGVLSVALLRLDPLYDPLRQLPGFQELLAKHG